MINKERYTEILSQLLNEHYDEIKKRGSASNARQQYIDGFLTAARALEAFDYDALKGVIEQVHFNAFGKTIEERRKSEVDNRLIDEKFLAIPTYIRDRIVLDKENSAK
ncbi:MAG: hypothetical protein K4571_00835 [Deltaproteobacteria bacterium]